MLKIAVFVPESHCEAVKQAMFAAGAGHIGEYECCAWQTAGRGQFRPLNGADPFIGKQGELEYVDEFRVEMICPEARIEAVVAALRDAHPYEEPAFDLWQLYEL